MVKNLSSRMDDKEFHRFKALMGRLEADTNDEAIVELMDFYHKYHGEDGEVQKAINLLEERGYEVVEPSNDD